MEEEKQKSDLKALAGETVSVTADDDPIEAVVYKYKQAAKQLCERLHRSSSLDQVSTT